MRRAARKLVYREMQKSLLEDFKATLPEVRPWGREFTAETAAEMLAYIRAGGSVRGWCHKVGVYPQWAMARLEKFVGRAAYEKARAEGMEHLAEAMMAVGSTPYMAEERIETTGPDGRTTVTVKVADAVEARKLCVRTGLEIMKSWAPERYGARTTVEAGGTLAAALMASSGRLKGREVPGDVVDVEPVEAAPAEAPALPEPEARPKFKRKEKSGIPARMPAKVTVKAIGVPTPDLF